MSQWTKFRRTDSAGIDGQAFISLRRSGVAFNAHFVRANGLDAVSRATVYVDADRRRVAFHFHSDANERDSFAMCIDGGSRGLSRLIQTQGLMAKHRWLALAASIDDTRSRQYTAARTPEGFWAISIRPAFEVSVLRSEKGSLPGDISGIYRYVDQSEVVYIGRGMIRNRLSAPERKEWLFDRIEYSPLSSSDEQAKWETEWLDDHRNRYGILPRYNRISGFAQNE